LRNNEILESLRNAKIYDLAFNITPDMAVHPTHPPYVFSLWKRHEDAQLGDGLSAAVDFFMMCGHHSTHIDALCHFAQNHKIHGGKDVATIESYRGFKEDSISNTPPIVARGILLDVANSKGQRELPSNYAISADDIKSCLGNERVDVLSGDVVLVRTGWAKYWNDVSTHQKVITQCPGLSGEASRWLVKNNVRCVGIDTDPDVSGSFESHKSLLIEGGINIIERIYLDEIAEGRVYEFIFICLPLKIVGATASPIRPIALTTR